MRITAVLAAVGLAVGLSTPAQAGVAHVDGTEDTCPAVAVVAARGSDQNSPEDTAATRYTPTSRWVSSGYEGPNIRAFLNAAEDRHPGLMDDVAVLGLDAEVYPAVLDLPALAEEGEDVEPLELIRRIVALLSTTPLHQLATDTWEGVRDSMERGITRTPGYLAQWERDTGCRPDYILVGYSQGALVLTPQEQWLADEGRLAGVLYFGNPAQPGGFLSPVAHRFGTPAAGVGRVDYCLADDYSCNTNVDNALAALRDGGGAHNTYFLQPRDSDAGVIDVFASWMVPDQL